MTAVDTDAVRLNVGSRTDPDALGLLALCDELDRLRVENARLLGVIERVADLCDDQRSEDAYHVLHDALEADR